MTNNTQHTPAPWKERTRTHHASLVEAIVIGNERELVAFVPAQDEANARLIIAAPKLLAALRQVLAWAEPESGNFTKEEIEWLDEARTAVAEANGRAA